MQEIHVHLLPMFLSGVDLSDGTAVVIDILRASTTITHALVNGAVGVIPAQEVEEALSLAKNYPKETILLGGERDCELIEGFDLDNSPMKYTADVVAGKRVIFTTTNGTKALNACGQAAEVVIGAFVNLSRVVRHLEHSSRDVHLVCAGTNGQLTGEDILFAGAVVDELVQRNANQWKLANVQTQMALDFYRAHSGSPQAFRSTFLESLGAQNLLKLNMLPDIERSMQRDLFSALPVWDAQQNLITLKA